MSDDDRRPAGHEALDVTVYTSPRSDPPPLVLLGGEESFPDYEAVFRDLYLSRPIFDPQGRLIVFNEEDCRHVCYSQDRHDKRSARIEGRDIERGIWSQDRAEHLSWILPAVTEPSFIVHDKVYRGNLVYLLGYPENDLSRPGRRYLVSVRPLNKSMSRCKFNTAYPIQQYKWEDALRAPASRRTSEFVLYRRKLRRW